MRHGRQGLPCLRRRVEHLTVAAAVLPCGKVLVAGGGIGGLVTTLAMQNAGLEVKCYERVGAYKPWGGPIQMAGNAMAPILIPIPYRGTAAAPIIAIVS